ncbi:LpxD N-terminal domain-containing protein, partial [Ferrovibrio sp.]|uniref:LpxD N-terminal domain-containing protein n=1 Tax=Ferrovibrio sp. TaxID=1917215 RepID=UPI00311F0CF2
MADPRFFSRAGPFSLGELAMRCGASLADAGLAARMVSDVASLDQAGPEQLSFLDNPKYVAALPSTRAGACILHEKHAAAAPAGLALLLSPNPYLSYARAAQLFYPAPPAVPGRHASAVVDPAARIGADVAIGPHVVIGAGAEMAAVVQWVAGRGSGWVWGGAPDAARPAMEPILGAR